MPSTPSATQTARLAVQDLTAECERTLAAEGPVALQQHLTDEAVRHFVALGFPEATARQELDQELATDDDPLLLLKTLVLQQRIVEQLGATAAVAAAMASDQDR